MLPFVHGLRVPFTKSHAERDPRMIKLRMGTSEGLRSPQAAKDFAKLRSLHPIGAAAGPEAHRRPDARLGESAGRAGTLADALRLAKNRFAASARSEDQFIAVTVYGQQDCRIVS